VQAKFNYPSVYPLPAGAGHMALDL
jgi:hypothetical protein